MASNSARIAVALDMLRTARRLLKEAGATKALAKTRDAIRSAEGAQRHAESLSIRASKEDSR